MFKRRVHRKALCREIVGLEKALADAASSIANMVGVMAVDYQATNGIKTKTALKVKYTKILEQFANVIDVKYILKEVIVDIKKPKAKKAKK